MPRIDRRTFLQSAVAIGATAAWASPLASASQIKWNERRDLFPEGVASGDPDSTSVLLWTRRPYAAQTGEKTLHAEIAEDSAFTRIVATSKAPVSAESDWTCRILARRPETLHGLLVSLHRSRRKWQQNRPDDYGSQRARRPPRALRLRELPKRQPGRSKRLPPHDL